MIQTKLIGGNGNNVVVVSSRGQLVTGDLEFSKFYTASAVANSVAVNVVPPKTGMRFVITAIVLTGDRSIAASGAITDVFESTVGPTTATVSVEIYQDEIAKQTRAVLTGLNIIVTEGSWVNVKADDVIVRCNISGYYVSA